MRLLVAVLWLFLAQTALAGSFLPWPEAAGRASAPAAALVHGLACDPVVDIEVGETLCGDTTGLVSNIDGYACSPWPETGGEIVYRLVLAEPTVFEAALEADCDLDLALLAGCDAQDECFLVADTGVKADQPVTGEFFLIVDGYNGAACSFCLSVGLSDIVGTESESWSAVKALYESEGRQP